MCSRALLELGLPPSHPLTHLHFCFKTCSDLNRAMSFPGPLICKQQTMGFLSQQIMGPLLHRAPFPCISCLCFSEES